MLTRSGAEVSCFMFGHRYVYVVTQHMEMYSIFFTPHCTPDLSGICDLTCVEGVLNLISQISDSFYPNPCCATTCSPVYHLVTADLPDFIRS
jgi:hypothetical protein